MGADAPPPPPTAVGPRADVEIVKLDVTGGFDPAIARRYLKRAFAGLQTCYAATPQPGELHVDLTLAANGTVATHNVTGIDHDLAACADQIFAPMQLPKPTGPAPVRIRASFALRAP